MSSIIRSIKLALAHEANMHQTYSQSTTQQSSLAESIPRLLLRGLQFLFGLIIVGIYGVNVGKGEENADNWSAAWYFGLIVAVIACISALFLARAAPLSPVSKNFKAHCLFGWDLVLFFFWIIVFGVFTQIFHKRSDDDQYKGSDTSEEKAAAWLDLFNALLWLTSGVYGAVRMWVLRRRNTLGAAQRRLSSQRGSAPITRERDDKDSVYSYADSQVTRPESTYSHVRY